jgi:hypothetical protein
MADIEIRQANALDVAALYHGPQKRSMRAVVVTVDQIPLGLGGIYYEDSRIIAFARIKPELRQCPFAIYKAARIVRNMIERRGATVFAVADPAVDRSRELLEHLGFDRVGEVYQWTTLARTPTS